MSLLLLLLLAGFQPDGPDEDDDLPVIGRPADLPFSGASGQFDAETNVDPKTVQAEAPLTLTLTVRVKPGGKVRRPPGRIDISKLPGIKGQFYLEEPKEQARHPDPTTWEFIYVLKPHSTDVTEVPSIPFVYHNPQILQAEKSFQVCYTEARPIRVLPAEQEQVKVNAPESIFQVLTGPGVLATRRPWSLPALPWLAIYLIIPPLTCVLFYVSWRWRNPDAARLARHRRSRAAERAHRALARADRLPPRECAEAVFHLFARYLRERFDLPVAEPVPAETQFHLTRAGLVAELCERTVSLIRAVDGARFGGEPANDLVRQTREVIEELETST